MGYNTNALFEAPHSPAAEWNENHYAVFLRLLLPAENLQMYNRRVEEFEQKIRSHIQRHYDEL
eukprot:NODE_7317_length_264_cov_110.427907_g6704_i0.p2 GENE.NODE_7317_length_264_cov_110.427907_g6704_i0~~NODE_7317_length_264_cov_110.427907_g6704_i0.p2  ORF type:complete len:73 (-),score=27.80 NODE_7317_length_264_cov_110.427907_g6704_i0:45-233(-)